MQFLLANDHSSDIVQPKSFSPGSSSFPGSGDDDLLYLKVQLAVEDRLAKS